MIVARQFLIHQHRQLLLTPAPRQKGSEPFCLGLATYNQLQDQVTEHARPPGELIIEQLLLEWLDAHREQALWLVPAFAFAEACIGIGLIISGAFLVIVATTLLTTDSATLKQIVPLAFAGALLGDHVGFYSGRWIGPGFHHTRLAEKYRSSVQKTEAIMLRYGALVVFVGRFIPAIRSLVPPMLGIAGFQPLLFTALDVAACVLWSTALGLILLGTSQVFS